MAVSSAIKVFGSELNITGNRLLLEVLSAQGIVQRGSPGEALAEFGPDDRVPLEVQGGARLGHLRSTATRARVSLFPVPSSDRSRP